MQIKQTLTTLAICDNSKNIIVSKYFWPSKFLPSCLIVVEFLTFQLDHQFQSPKKPKKNVSEKHFYYDIVPTYCRTGKARFYWIIPWMVLAVAQINWSVKPRIISLATSESAMRHWHWSSLTAEVFNLKRFPLCVGKVARIAKEGNFGHWREN